MTQLKPNTAKTFDFHSVSLARITKSFPKSFNVAHDPTKTQYDQSLWFSMSLGLHSQSFPKSFNVAHVTKQLRSEIVPRLKTSSKYVEIRNKLNATADRKFNPFV